MFNDNIKALISKPKISIKIWDKVDYEKYDKH